MEKATILVIEDEELIQEMLVRALTRSGYEVLIAANGYDGIQLFRAHANRIRCVLLDMLLPDMSGEEVLMLLQTIRATLTIIMISGSYDEGVIVRLTAQPNVQFIEKPFSLLELRAAIERGLTNT
jgi:DNA-binding response OmpR family regulator